MAAAGAQHAHAESAVLFLVMGDPGFLLASGGKNATADDVADDNVPVTPNPGGRNRVVDRFIIVERNRDKGRRRLAIQALLYRR